MQLTADLIYAFSSGMLQSRYDNPVATPAVHMDFWRLCTSVHKKVAIAAPRGHAKSTSVTHAYTLAEVLFRESQHVMIVSDTEGQAKDFLKDIKIELQENEEIIETFQVNEFIKESETEIIVSIGEDNHQFRIVAKGSGQKVRGTKWRHKRPDLIVGDDLENDDIMLNAERREKFRKWFNNALVPCLSKHGKIRIVGTILHLDSMLERLMPAEDPKKPHVHLIETPLADYTDEVNPTWKSVRYRAHSPDFEHILWPEQFDQARLEEIRQTYVDDGNPEGYSQEYLNYPIDESTSYFRKEDFLPMKDEDWNKPMTYYVGGDFAISRKTKADFSVLSVVGIDSDGMAYLVDVRRGRWDTKEIVDEIMSLYDTYKPESFYFENGQIFLTMETMLTNVMMRTGKFFDYEPVQASDDKQIRARPLQFRVRAKGIRFDKEAPWYDMFEMEMIRFPKAAKDDQVDSVAHIFLKLAELQDAPTARELIDEQYDEEYEEWEAEEGEDGMSMICGY